MKRERTQRFGSKRKSAGASQFRRTAPASAFTAVRRAEQDNGKQTQKRMHGLMIASETEKEGQRPLFRVGGRAETHLRHILCYAMPALRGLLYPADLREHPH